MRASVLAILWVLISWPAFGATLLVGDGGAFKTLASAVNASSAGDTIILSPGDYIDDFAVVRHPLTIRSNGGKARLHATGLIPNGKAIIVAKAPLSIWGIIFSNAKVQHKNGAGIRHEKGLLFVRDSVFENNENGILGESDPSASIIIQTSLFLGNGHGDGYSHAIYVGKIGMLKIENSLFSNTKTGHHIKSRARSTFINECLLDDGTSSSSYSIDLPNGGNNIIRGNILVQNSKTANDIFISVGTKKARKSNGVTIKGNQFFNFSNNGVAVRNAMHDEIVVEENTFFGPMTIATGRIKESANTSVTSLPIRNEILQAWLTTRSGGRMEAEYGPWKHSIGDTLND